MLPGLCWESNPAQLVQQAGYSKNKFYLHKQQSPL
uniref:Uncharacterized protein n=1 Tax=Candidatus Nitrotoga fabula TaxID=2182327 RepID=A0A2X0R9L5_9PROT|nr:protein of unknown function [Candidatus Nitrotoga fabula]